MTKAELIKKWKEGCALESGISCTTTHFEVLLQSLCGVIARELFEGGEVSLPSLGKLAAMRVKGRDYRNVRTGEKYHVPAHLRVAFRPSKGFRGLLN